LRTVWGTGPTDVLAAGEDGVLLHFNGATWTTLSSPTDRLMVQLFGAPGSPDVYGVGVAATIIRGRRN